MFAAVHCFSAHDLSQHDVSRRTPFDGHKSPRFAPWNMLAKILNSGSEAIKTYRLHYGCHNFATSIITPRTASHLCQGAAINALNTIGLDEINAAQQITIMQRFYDDTDDDRSMRAAFCVGHIRPSMVTTCRYCLWARCLRKQVGSVLLQPEEVF